MNINFKNKAKRIISGVMAAGVLAGIVPTVSFAAQSNEYTDPADVWMTSNSRTNELDINATTTYETFFCPVCDMETNMLVYRVPEYTKSGGTALNRGVKFSDGTTIDGSGTGNVDSGTPGMDAKYTGYHYTKAVCQNCGIINANEGKGSYAFGKNVYSLYSCDSDFFLDFDNTTYLPYDSKYHTEIYKAGKYCQYCKGTHAEAEEHREKHSFDESVEAELGNQRFHVTGVCDDCGYTKNEYVAAKKVVESYYGKVDGKAHSVTLSDLSEDGVHTQIRFGTKADNCNLTSAPSYTDEGYYPVYYEIDYKYGDVSMTENGVSYVWLLDNNADKNGELNGVHVHDYRFLETVRPTCTELGYDRFQCNECGALMKTNYVPANGHDYDTVVIREASCQQGGLVLHICKTCGNHYTENTSMTDHKYTTNTIPATCTMNGFTEHVCIDCGYKYITDLTPLAKHDYRPMITPPTCTEHGYVTYVCAECGDTYISDYSEPTGHDWDNGHVVTGSTCDSEGVMEYHCKKCDEKMIQAISAKGHKPGPEATCTDPQICSECGAVLELPKGHNYSETVTPPTCVSMGFSTFVCNDCGKSYVGNYTDKILHHYHEEITPATCTELGYTTYKCEICGDEYKSDYTEKKPHSFKATVTPPTCTSMGHTDYVCEDCGESYIGDYTDVLPHNYTKKVVEPTCTSQGYTIYTCPDCGREYIGDEKESIEHHYSKKVTEPTCDNMGFSTYVCDDCHYSYIADYTDPLGHDYAELVVPPTCTEIGHSVFTCSRCGDEYVGNEKAKKPHDYEAKVTEPTCTELGHTDYECKSCGDTYTSDYVEAKGHNNSDWIIDVPSTIEHDGSRHIECTVCGEILKTEVIPQLTEKDNSDEDGHSVVGNYSVLVTDKDGKPVFNNEISVDTIGNISIRMPEGRLISAEDMTTVTVTYTETKQPAEGVRIFISDYSDNAATGTTNENGQLTVPNSSSSTGNSNGTVSDGSNTYVVVVTDKDGNLIPNCDVTAGENYSIDVKLPENTAFNTDNRITVTVVTEHGKPVSDLRVQVIGDGDYIENGYTNINGQVTLPISNTDITDGNGNAEVGDRDGDKVYDFIVTVSDETELIENALVTLIAKDNSVLVCLAEGKKIDYYNRTTVKVTRSDGTAVEGWKVTVYNKDGSNIRTEVTDENGIVIVPPLSEAPIANPTPSPEPDADATPLPGVDATAAPQATTEPDATTAPTNEPDMGGGSVVENRSYKYRVFVWDNDGVIKSFGLIKLQDDGSIRIELPENKYLDVQNKVHIRVINENDGAPVKGITVNVTDQAGTSASDITNSNGIAIVPVSDSDYTDGNGNAQVKDNEGNIYNVNVNTEKKGNIENAFVQVTDGKIIVVLPDGTVIDYSDRTTVTVTDRDNAPVAELPVNVKDNNGGDRTENTDENGKAVVPPLTEGYTDKDGKAIVGDYTVIVEDTKEKIEGAFVEIKDSKISVLLPDGHTLLTSNQTTVTVLDNADAPVKGMSVTVTDTNAKTATKTTDAKGKVTVPIKTSGGGGGGSSRGGGSSSSYVTYNITVTDKNGKSVPATKSTTANDITLTLPKSYGMTDNYYTITVKDSAGKTVEGRNVTLRDYEGKNSADGKTDKDGTVILPASEHAAYVIGYEDGSFRPEGSMTRAEAAAIFARNIAERKGESIVNQSTSFSDVDMKLWYNQYISYLEKYDIINGYADKTFRPDAPVTRAEFVAMCTRFYKLFEQMPSTNGSRFNDVSSSHWAYSFINSATAKKWLNGYAAGCMGEQCSEAERPATRSFRPDNSITRAEVVAIVNRVTERRADTEYVNRNLTTVNPFTDMKDKSYWAYYDVIEAANEHMAVLGTDSESWVK